MGYATANPTGTGNTALIAAVAANKAQITRLELSNDGSARVSVILKDGTTERWRHNLSPGAWYAWEREPNGPYFLPLSQHTANTAVNLALDATGSVRAKVWYSTFQTPSTN